MSDMYFTEQSSSVLVALRCAYELLDGERAVFDPVECVLTATSGLNSEKLWAALEHTPELWDRFAACTETPPALLAKFAECVYRVVWFPALSNPSTPQGALTSAVETHEVLSLSDTQATVALRNPSYPPAGLLTASKSKSIMVRRSVASNPTAPGFVLTRLAEDLFENVRSAVAANRSSPPVVLAALARDYEPWVVSRVAENISTPRETLELLAKDTVKRSSATGIASAAKITLAQLVHITT